MRDKMSDLGLEPIDPLRAVGAKYSFVSSEATRERLAISYFRRERDGALVARVWFGPKAEGPPFHAHGGSIAAVLDEAMGAAAWMMGETVVIARLLVTFRQPVPLGTDATIETWLTRKRGKKVWVCSRLMNGDECTYAEGQGLFIVQPMNRFTNLANKN